MSYDLGERERSHVNKLTNQKQFWFLLSGGKNASFLICWGATRRLPGCNSGSEPALLPFTSQEAYIRTIFLIYALSLQLKVLKIQSGYQENENSSEILTRQSMSWPEHFFRFVFVQVLIHIYFLLFFQTFLNTYKFLCTNLIKMCFKAVQNLYKAAKI